MSTLLNVLIDDIVEMNNEKEFEEIKMEVLSEIASIENEDIAFESIVKGDNFVRRFLSRLGKAISTGKDNGSKINFDLKVFRKIDKSKITKDVTGVATPEYVKSFVDILLTNPTFTKEDIEELSKLTQKVNLAGGVKSAILGLLSSITSLTSIGYYFCYFFIVAAKSNLFMGIALDIIALILSIYSKKSIKYATDNMTNIDVNRLLDLTAKLLNTFLGVNSTKIDNTSYAAADSIINKLNNKSQQTISTADQNKVADMLLKLSDEFKSNDFDATKFNLSGANMNIFKEFIKDVKSGNDNLDAGIVEKMDNIIALSQKIDQVAKVVAEASNTIMRDIRKW